MPCMCGDTMCPSCGPAQGYDPGLEAVCDRIIEAIPEIEDLPNSEILLEKIAELIRNERKTAQRILQFEIHNRLLKEHKSFAGKKFPPLVDTLERPVLKNILTSICERD